MIERPTFPRLGIIANVEIANQVYKVDFWNLNRNYEFTNITDGKVFTRTEKQVADALTNGLIKIIF
ncbi:MAG: hypothetical protein WCJ62_08450 [Flavobacterium sp.]